VEAGRKVTLLEIAKLEAFWLTEARLDVARLAGWFLLAVLVVVLLFAWTWRYRQELWHRARALALLGLVLLCRPRLQAHRGRSSCPTSSRGRASMLVAILLGAGPPRDAAMLAILAGAANGLSLSAAYRRRAPGSSRFGAVTGEIFLRRDWPSSWPTWSSSRSSRC
jgi:hypothetical protein